MGVWQSVRGQYYQMTYVVLCMQKYMLKNSNTIGQRSIVQDKSSRTIKICSVHFKSGKKKVTCNSIHQNHKCLITLKVSAAMDFKLGVLSQVVLYIQ